MFLDHTSYLPSMICKALKMAASFIYQFKILWAKETWATALLVQGNTHFCICLFRSPNRKPLIGMDCDLSFSFSPTWHPKDAQQMRVHIGNYPDLPVDRWWLLISSINPGKLGFAPHIMFSFIPSTFNKYLLSLYYVPSPCKTREF